MTQEQKARITQLRQENVGYASIARELSLSIVHIDDDVNGLSGTKAIRKMHLHTPDFFVRDFSQKSV